MTEGRTSKLAVRTFHPKSSLLHRLQVRAAGHQRDVGALTGQPCADVPADRAGAGNDDLHDAVFPNASATTLR